MFLCGRISRLSFLLIIFIIFIFLLEIKFFSPSRSQTHVVFNRRNHVTSTPDHQSRGLLVDTASCKIPDVDPFDKSILHLIRRRGKILCVGKPSITFEEGSVLRLNWTVINEYYKGDFKYCKYQPIIRGPKGNDFYFTYGPFKKSFSSDVQAKHEFIRVYCYSKSGGKIYTNFHSIVIPKPEVEEQCDTRFRRYLKRHQPKEKLNVMMIGVDSVSRLNLMRQMPRTREFLLRNLSAVEMLGYTKVADNTFVNIVPMTTGKYVEELPWNETMVKTPFDKYDFIWKEFSKNGFKTLYAEDAPKIAMFQYGKAGFHTPPADFYNRVFSVAMEKHKSVWNHNHHCVGDRMESDIVLKYVRDFAVQNTHKATFAFAFITRPSHDYANDAGIADDPHFRFLNTLRDDGILKNTVLIYYSDHGNRYGRIRNTFIGKLEERLPFLFLVFPRWFLIKYKEIARNLQVNSKRLSTPFDVYETLKDILYFTGNFPKRDRGERGISLLREIPKERSCFDASIMPHWCMCFSRKKLSNTSTIAVEAAYSLLLHLNKILYDYRYKCAPLEIFSIIDVTVMMPNNNGFHFEQSLNDVINRTVHYGNRTDAFSLYQLTVVSKPGGGMFESTVKYDERTARYSVDGDVSRINVFGDQSKCMDRFHLKKYCFCHSNT
ncbi:uncharacterized protein LOC121373967 isoform X1 [Gigantopelta aegis]|uniref:uncharacterized protein LOC121373967 isoform X1 n=1 Tax=Gigantopelta aegis TaxID=1735272 RepID=UPI001B88CBD2|nr:uncharacterized protein LOC121373967 isoform X1 [Gigantopelta aegis]